MCVGGGACEERGGQVCREAHTCLRREGGAGAGVGQGSGGGGALFVMVVVGAAGVGV